MPLPVVTVTKPQSVQNVASLKDIVVYGSNFFNSKGLVCLVNSQQVRATFLSEGSVVCDVQTAKSIIGQAYIEMQVSNDAAVTVSNKIRVPF